MERKKRRAKAGAFLAHISLTSVANEGRDAHVSSSFKEPDTNISEIIENASDPRRFTEPAGHHASLPVPVATHEDSNVYNEEVYDVQISQPKKTLRLYRQESVAVAPTDLPGWMRRKSVEEHMTSDRVCLTTKGGHVFAVFSVLGHKSVAITSEEAAKPPQPSDTDNITPQASEIIGFSAGSSSEERSFAHLLISDPYQQQSGVDGVTTEFDPPGIRKNKTVLNLPSWVVSMLPYSSPQDLKHELNEQFSLVHPWVHPSLSLSKIRSCKRRMIQVALETKSELSSAALGHVYFERLIRGNHVRKNNRKVLAAVCMVLGIKFNDAIGRLKSSVFEEFLASTCRIFETSPHEVLRREFLTFVDLGFSLLVPKEEVFPAFTRIIQSLDMTVHEYHDDDDLLSYHLQGAQQIAFEQ